jgi:cytochrome P450
MSASTISHPGMRPPGPETGRGFGVAFEASRNYLAYFTKIAEQYGDLALIRFFRLQTLFINNPEYIESVLVTNYQKFHKSPDYRALHLLLGNGLLTSEGEFWRRQRRLAQPAFHRERISSYSSMMVASTDQMLGAWRPGVTLDVHREMMHLTLDIVAKCLFTADVTEVAHVVGAALEVSMLQYVERAKTGFLIPDWVPTPGNLRYRRAVKKLDAIIYGVIEQHRKRGQADDLLGMLLAARDDDGRPMTDRQLRDEVMTLFLAGHETTANTLAWTLYLLAQNPEAEARLHTELDDVLGQRLPSMADVAELRYTGQVVKESMRLYPPAWGIGRQAQEPFEVGGYRFEKDTYVFICQYITHRDRRYFPDPERFDPNRWNEESARKVPRFAYLPFGAGPRVCIGAAFAAMETSLLLATIAQRFRLTLHPTHRVVPLTSITLRPKYGILMELHSR